MFACCFVFSLFGCVCSRRPSTVRPPPHHHTLSAPIMSGRSEHHTGDTRARGTGGAIIRIGDADGRGNSGAESQLTQTVRYLHAGHRRPLSDNTRMCTFPRRRTIATMFVRTMGTRLRRRRERTRRWLGVADRVASAPVVPSAPHWAAARATLPNAFVHLRSMQHHHGVAFTRLQCGQIESQPLRPIHGAHRPSAWSGRTLDWRRSSSLCPSHCLFFCFLSLFLFSSSLL